MFKERCFGKYVLVEKSEWDYLKFLKEENFNTNNSLFSLFGNKIAELSKENEELKKYKQLYADEVQKRLELINFYEGKS